MTTSLRLAPGALATLIGLAAASPCVPASAEMYRWVDENGVTVYSQSPPPQGPATQIKADAAPSEAEAERARERLRQQVETEIDRREAARQGAEKTAQAAQETARRRTNCEAARHNLETVRNLGPRMLLTPDGQYLRLSDEDRAQHIAEAEKQIAENCE